MNNSSQQPSTTSPSFVAFMAHIPLSQLETVETDIKKYTKNKYLITAESKPYEHLHYYVEFSNNDYERYRDNILKRKYKLIGRATENQCRQYGKISQVRDKTRYMSYILKQKGPLVTNLTKDYLVSIPPWTEKIIPGYKYSDYLKKKDRENFIEEIKKYYQVWQDIPLTNDENYHKQITTRDIAKLWLNKRDQALPRWDTLIYMCYQAKILSQDKYIEIKYSNNSCVTICESYAEEYLAEEQEDDNYNNYKYNINN
jgi:hypothetical protein